MRGRARRGAHVVGVMMGWLILDVPFWRDMVAIEGLVTKRAEYDRWNEL